MVSIGFHFGAKTSRYGPHELGNRRATKAKQNDAIPSRKLIYIIQSTLGLGKYALFFFYLLIYIQKICLK